MREEDDVLQWDDGQLFRNRERLRFARVFHIKLSGAFVLSAERMLNVI
jgi:hypothetical protein